MCKTNLLNGSYMAITFVVDGLSVDGLGLTEFFVDLWWIFLKGMLQYFKISQTDKENV